MKIFFNLDLILQSNKTRRDCESDSFFFNLVEYRFNAKYFPCNPMFGFCLESFFHLEVVFEGIKH